MKKLFFLFVALSLGINLLAQSDQERGHPTGGGLFLSMSIGVSYLSINDDITGATYDNMTFKGTGGAMTIQAGSAIKDNLIIHGDVVYTSTSSADITGDGELLGTLSGDNSIGMTLFGGGLTYYIMPQNIFLSGTVGVAKFNITTGDNTVSTQSGFGIFAKVGKEWYVSKNWDLGFNIGLNYSNVSNEVDSMSEKLSGISIGLGFNATFN